MEKEGGLTARQKRFIIEYIKKPVGGEAARAAGYSHKGADRAAVRLLVHPLVRAEIDAAQQELAKVAMVDATWVLNQGKELADRCMGKVTPKIDRKGNPIIDEDGHPVYEFDSTGAAKGVEIVGKVIGAFSKKDVKDPRIGLPSNIFNILYQKVQSEAPPKAIEA